MILSSIRSSSLPMYPDCPRRWAARFMTGQIEAMLGLKLKTTRLHVGAATGSATHAGAASMLQHKVDTGELGNMTEAEHRALDELASRMADGTLWDDTTPNYNAAEVAVRKQLQSYRINVAERIQPIAVEQKLKVQHASGLVITGTSDVIIVRPDTLRDLKTGRIKRAHHAQYGTYTRQSRAHDYKVDNIVEDYMPRVAAHQAQPPPIEVPYNLAVAEEVSERVIRRIASDLAEFERDPRPQVFIANPSSMLCGEKWCPAWGTKWCREHRGAV